MNMKPFVVITLLAAVITVPGRATTIEIGPANARAVLGSADSGNYGAQNGTSRASDIGAAFPGTGPWISAGQLTSNGTSGLLTTTVTSGAWGSDPVSGTWAISPSFWSTYTSAIISIHVGGNQSSPVTWFAWTITPGQTSGNWTYSNDYRGGGFSNMELWGSTQPTGSNVIGPGPQDVPDAGSSLALMGLALFGLGLASRKAKR